MHSIHSPLDGQKRAGPTEIKRLFAERVKIRSASSVTRVSSSRDMLPRTHCFCAHGQKRFSSFVLRSNLWFMKLGYMRPDSASDFEFVEHGGFVPNY